MQEGSPAEKLLTCQEPHTGSPLLPRVTAPPAPPPPPTQTSLSPLHFSPIFVFFPLFQRPEAWEQISSCSRAGHPAPSSFSLSPPLPSSSKKIYFTGSSIFTTSYFQAFPQF